MVIFNVDTHADEALTDFSIIVAAVDLTCFMFVFTIPTIVQDASSYVTGRVC